MKRCNTCNELKELDSFHKYSRSTDGLKSSCKSCRNEEKRLYNKNNKEKVDAYHKQRYAENKEEHLARCVSWQRQNKNKVSEYQKTYRRRHKGRIAAKNRKRELDKLQRTPAWADVDLIKGVYELASYLTDIYGKAIHVDHVIPLKGKTVSGLHVENNLQLLYAEENLSKGNTFKENELGHI